MEKIQGINYRRIVWCCNDANISIAELAREISISESTFEKCFEGKKDLTFSQIKKVADYFGRGVLFFIDPSDVQEFKVHSAAFRTLKNKKPEMSSAISRLIERAELQRDIYLDLREELSYFDNAFVHPEISDGVAEAAEEARSWLGLTFENDFESYRRAVERKGLLVFKSNGYNGKWQISKSNPTLGFSLYHEKCPVIFVKKQFYESRQNFTLMHELGHVLLHKSSDIDDDSDFSSRIGLEREANSFAGRVLVPDAFLKLVTLWQKPDDVREYDGWLQPIRKRSGASTEVVLLRMIEHDLISQAEYINYKVWQSNLVMPEPDSSGTRMYRHREPKSIFGDGYVRVVLDALDAKNITLSKASTYLDGLKISDLHALEEYYASL